MTPVPVVPAGTMLDRDIAAGDDVHERFTAAARVAARAGAHAFGRDTCYVQTMAEVDAFAEQWGTEARWEANGSRRHYVTRLGAHTDPAQAEAVYIPVRHRPSPLCPADTDTLGTLRAMAGNSVARGAAA